MNTVVELLLPYLELEDVATVGNTNKYWSERIHGLLPLDYYLTINYSDGILMSGSVYELRIPLPSICTDEWKLLFTLNSDSVPPFDTLKFFVVSINPKNVVNPTPLFHMYKSDGVLCWSSAQNSRYDFRPRSCTNLEKIQLEFSLKLRK